MVLSNDLTPSQIANAVGCHPSTITRHATNMNLLGDVKAPPNKGGRPRRLTPVMLKALCDHLLENPHLYLDEMAIFLWEEFQVHVTTCSIGRALKREAWSKKAAKYKASERNADLRDTYFHFMSDFCSKTDNKFGRQSSRQLDSSGNLGVVTQQFSCAKSFITVLQRKVVFKAGNIW
jgi:transposase